MSYSGEAAEQMVRMSLEGAEVAAKITGTGAKQVAVLLYAVLQEQKKTKGKTRLSNMLRSGKELKVFAVQDGGLKRFCQEAKKYGVLYCVLKDQQAKDGITDIMVRAEDASKINRIFQRFQLSTVDVSQVRSEIQRSLEETQTTKEGGVHSANPTQARTGASHPSEPISGPRKPTDRDNSEQRQPQRPSVRKELQGIAQEQQRRGKGPRAKAVEHPLGQPGKSRPPSKVR